MLKKVLVSLTILLSCAVSAQNVTVDQLIALSKKDLGDVEEYLTANNWDFFDGVDETKKSYGNAKFVFDRPNFKPTDPAEYFATFYFSEDEGANALEISFRKKPLYDTFLIEIKDLSFKLIDSKTTDGNITKVYRKGSSIIEVSIPPDFTATNSYKFLFAKRSSYKKFR